VSLSILTLYNDVHSKELSGNDTFVSNCRECLNVMLYILSCDGRFDKIMDDKRGL